VEEMSKRTAMSLAAGVAAAFLAAMVAISINLGSTASGGESTQVSSSQARPIVRTQTRTVTVHRKAKAPQSAGGVVTIVRSSGSGAGTSGPSVGSTGPAASDDQFDDDDGFDDDGFEDEWEDESEDEHEDEHEDHSGSGGGEDDD
jgi:hypothetical protein